MPVQPVARLLVRAVSAPLLGRCLSLPRRRWPIHPIALQLSCRGCNFMTWPYPSGGNLKCKFGSPTQCDVRGGPRRRGDDSCRRPNGRSGECPSQPQRSPSGSSRPRPIPGPGIPRPDIDVPDIDVPKLDVPNMMSSPTSMSPMDVIPNNVNLPNVPGNVNLPNVNLPNVPGNVNLPNVNVSTCRTSASQTSTSRTTSRTSSRTSTRRKSTSRTSTRRTSIIPNIKPPNMAAAVAVAVAAVVGSPGSLGNGST